VNSHQVNIERNSKIKTAPSSSLMKWSQTLLVSFRFFAAEASSWDSQTLLGGAGVSDTKLASFEAGTKMS
jgi:hypothetical protein